MNLTCQSFLEQNARWPQQGQHILAHHDHDTVVVYQAYRPSIGCWAIEHGHFGGPNYSLSRMSWIKPNFLWMMYRSGWGQKEGQEITLGIRLGRAFFDAIVAAAVPSSHDSERYASRDAWQEAVTESDVRLQWDPDHDPHGGKVERRAIQLGLRGDMLRALAVDEVCEIIDMTAFVAEQRQHVRGDLSELQIPIERVYPPRCEV